MGKKIRDNELKKVPYMIVLGEEEVKSGVLAIRKHGEGDLGRMTKEEFIAFVNKEIESQLNF